MGIEEVIKQLSNMKVLAGKIVEKEDLKAVKITWEEYYLALDLAIGLLKEKELSGTAIPEELQLINISRKQ